MENEDNKGLAADLALDESLAGPEAVSRPGLRRLFDFLLPHRCFSCQRELTAGPGLCPSCWSEVDFIAEPLCHHCGRPFEYDAGEGALCGACIADPPAFARARASFVYNAASRGLVTGFKYGDRTDRAAGYGRWLARAGKDILQTADIIIPVPLHPWRLWMRRYNQAGLLSAALSKETFIPVVYDGLKRVRHTRQQVGLSAAKRRRNVAGAFKANPARTDEIAGSHVVLIDDVVTSGATIVACTKALNRLKPKEVSVLCLARTHN